MLQAPVEVSEEWLGGVEPGCWLEEGGAVVFPYFPFLVVDGCVVVGAEGDGIINVGVAAVEPFDDVVDLAPDGWDGAPGGLAAPVPGQNSAALSRGE